jgi:hypothetical protein
MKIFVTESKLWWLSVADELRAQRGMPIVDVVRRLTEVFKFAAGPNTLPGPNEGYKFQEGAALVDGSTIAIREVTFFNDGVSVDVYSNTEDCIAVLQQILATLREFGMREPKTEPNVVLNSRLVVELSGNLNKLVTAFDPMSVLMSEVFGVKGPCDARSIEFQMDPKLAPPLNPTTFRIERRNETEHGQNRYFSFANTSTKNHVRLLEGVEGVLD